MTSPVSGKNGSKVIQGNNPGGLAENNLLLKCTIYSKQITNTGIFISESSLGEVAPARPAVTMTGSEMGQS